MRFVQNKSVAPVMPTRTAPITTAKIMILINIASVDADGKPAKYIPIISLLESYNGIYSA